MESGRLGVEMTIRKLSTPNFFQKHVKDSWSPGIQLTTEAAKGIGRIRLERNEFR